MVQMTVSASKINYKPFIAEDFDSKAGDDTDDMMTLIGDDVVCGWRRLISLSGFVFGRSIGEFESKSCCLSMWEGHL